METSSGITGGSIQARLSGRYATALFELALEANSLDAVAASLSTLREALSESEDFRTLTTSPLFARGDTEKGVAAVAGALRLDPITTRFLGVVAENRRLHALDAIARDFDKLVARHRGEVTAEVISAHPLDTEQVDALKQQLRQRVGREVNVDLSVDPALLGGLVVKIGSQMIDSSIKTRLNALAHAMKG